MKRERDWRKRQIQLAGYVNPAFGSVARMKGVWYSVTYSVALPPPDATRRVRLTDEDK